jgi:hypothetical protein
MAARMSNCTGWPRHFWAWPKSENLSAWIFWDTGEFENGARRYIFITLKRLREYGIQSFAPIISGLFRESFAGPGQYSRGLSLATLLRLLLGEPLHRVTWQAAAQINREFSY